MEKIPCISSNHFCDVSHPQKQTLQNRQYQSLLHYLFDEGWVVRDVAADDNYGYRRNGEQVWFDPVVAPWPKGGITPTMKNLLIPLRPISMIPLLRLMVLTNYHCCINP